jgi:hypothetical protein
MQPQTTVSSSGWLRGLFQTNHFSAILALSFSLILSACGGSGTDSGDLTDPGPDGVAPALTSVSIFNSFNSGDEVALGQTVKVEFTASESIMRPTVMIHGAEAEVSGQHSSWSAERTMGEADVDGDVTFSISFSDVSGVAGTEVTESTDGTYVTFCAEGCVDEGEADDGIAGDWKLAPVAGALGVGPSLGDTSWWSSGDADVDNRACIFDDIYRFGADGSFANVMGDETWLEGWQGFDGEGCGAPVAPHDGSMPATYTHDEAANTLTVDGMGAHIGLAKVYNGGELSSPNDAVTSITYTISAMTDDSMTLDIEIAGGGHWRFMLVKITASAITGDWKLAPVAGALGVGPALGDTSWWSSGEADVDNRGCLFDDIYRFGADGSFANVMGGETWVEGWQGAEAESCGAPVAPHDGSNAATYTFDPAGSTVTVDGLGAHIGLAKVYNGGELSSPNDAVTSIVYTITAMTDNSMTLDIEIAGGGYWRFMLAKVEAPAIAGDWKLAPVAGALGVGPALGDTSWWSSGDADVDNRACIFDDIYRFGADGSFANVMGDETWLEGWQGFDGEGCGAPVAPHDGSNAATYTYDEAGASITVDGLGAHIGLAKVYNGGELGSPNDAASSITYTISAMTDDSMTLDIEIAGGGYWRFMLARDVPAEAPAIAGDWKLAPVAGALGVGPAQGDTSWWSSGEADVDNRACIFDDIYRFGADGSFANVMGGETWLEGWQGFDGEGCGAPVAPHDGSNAATYTYNEAATTITVDGLGAHIGLAKVYNGGELGSPNDAASSITYTITAMTDDSMTLDIEIAGGGYWRFMLARADAEPEQEVSALTGDWKLAPVEGALGVGPAQGDTSWWSSGSADVDNRACIFDDVFRFGADGSFANVMGSETWLEGWQGFDGEGCGAPVAPHDGSNAATFTHDDVNNTITVDGLGAHIGLAKVVNGGELGSPNDAVSSIVYTITAMTADSMTLDIEIAGGGYWRFMLAKD